MLRTALSAAFLVMTAPATSGCATALLLNYAGKPVENGYLASYADSAWRGDNGALKICFYGWPAGQPVSESTHPYTLTVPASALDSLAGPAGTVQDARAALEWAVPREDIESGCRDWPETGLPVAVRRSSALTLDSEGLRMRTPINELLASADLDQPEPVIYSLDDAGVYGAGIIVYQFEAPLRDGARFVRLNPPYSESNNSLLLLLPVTLAIDAALIILTKDAVVASIVPFP